MSRINKIVERKKKELGIDEIDPAELAEKAKEAVTREIDKKLADRKSIQTKTESYNYTETRTVELSDEQMRDNRIIATDPVDPRATAFQMLRTKVLQQMRTKSWNTLAITAPTPGAGKSLVATNLAASIAQEGNQSVLLVDMDLRNPSVHRYFGFKPEFGIHDCLDGSAQLTQTLVNPGLERLVILPGRKGVLNSSEQISTPYIRNLVEEVKTRYESRIVIFDLPPILVADDVLVFLPYVDCSLLVVGAGDTTKKDVEDSLRIMGENPLLGTILNKSSSAKNNFIY